MTAKRSDLLLKLKEGQIAKVLVMQVARDDGFHLVATSVKTGKKAKKD